MEAYNRVHYGENYAHLFGDDFTDNQKEKLINAFCFFDHANEEKVNKIMIKINNHHEEHVALKNDIKKDLLIELATKADIMQLKGDINSLEKELKGNMNSLEKELKGNMNSLEKELKGMIISLEKELKGENKSIRVWMKVLVGTVLVGMSFFSPMAVELIRLLK